MQKTGGSDQERIPKSRTGVKIFDDKFAPKYSVLNAI